MQNNRMQRNINLYTRSRGFTRRKTLRLLYSNHHEDYLFYIPTTHDNFDYFLKFYLTVFCNLINTIILKFKLMPELIKKLYMGV